MQQGAYYAIPMISRLPSRKIHTSWLIGVFCFGLVVGVIGVLWMPSGLFASVSWLIGGVGLMAIGLWRHRMYAVFIVLVAGCLVGLWRGGMYRHDLAPYERLIGMTVTIRGFVTDDADTGKNDDLVLRLNDIHVNGRPLKGSVWVSAGERASIQRSDTITVKGRLSEGFGSFAASMYRAELVKTERPQPGDIALKVRDWFAGGVRQAIPEPEASLGVGYVAGQRRNLPEELDKSLRAAGLTHIVVASGYNLTILVEASRRLFAKISKYMAALSGSVLIAGFIAVTGMSPSMSRAGLVAALGLLAWYYGRRFHPLVLLPLAAAVTLLINPAYGWGDLGWQLSFASFAGVLMVAPLLQRYFFGEKEPGIIRQILGETLSAWLCTLPLIVLVFGEFSNVAILANILVLPLVPLAMLLTVAAGAVALLVPPLASFVGLPAHVILSYTTYVADYLGNLSWAQTALSITPLIFAGYYILLVGFCGYMWIRTHHDFIGRGAVE
jgi:competence protein ComEC